MLKNREIFGFLDFFVYLCSTMIKNEVMTQEEKQLLLKDLSARLSYGVVINYNGLARPLFGIEPTQHFQITLDNALDGEHNGLVYVSLDVDGEEPKPYLRPMSSMTEEEKLMYEGLMIGTDNVSYMLDVIDWLNAHHFDYRGLIEKGLAIAVTEENNPYKE